MPIDEDSIRERIQKLIHSEGISQKEFALKINANPSNLSQTLLGSRHIPKGMPADIISAYPNLHREWLLFGEGEMYKDEDDHLNKCCSATKPCLPTNISEGHLSEYFTGMKRQLCIEKPTIHQFGDYDFTMVIKGKSMEPVYQRGDELAFKLVKIYEWGKEYLLDTEEGPKFKKIYEDKHDFRCVSYNSAEFPDFLVPKTQVYAIYKCVGMIRV